ncbi:MAG TPA: toprim domain-containing protein, partial [Marmoricola sp.]
HHGPDVDAPPDPDFLPPEDADDFMAAFYRVQSNEPADWAPLDEPTSPAYDDATFNAATFGALHAQDPYAPTFSWENEDIDNGDSRSAFPDPNELPAARIHELNQQALAYFETCYPRSWAPDYMRDRLGTDLTDHTTYTVGYAPGGGRSLIRHMTNHGATLDELEQAGLVSLRERNDGSTYYSDFFKDRLVLPIRDPHDPTGQAILGFVGRRNPTKTDDDQGRNWAGPKYLNTRTTPVFTKGEALFGYAETRDLLAGGALPVLVEGPMDALAITLGSNGTAAGIAPMGTALTIDQIKLLLGHISLVDGRDRIAVATDSDPAGWTSARKAFWHLTAADLDPTHLELPDGLDPAKLFETEGADAINAAIENRGPLGDAMVDHLLRTAGHWSDSDVRQKIIHQAARILGSRGSENWLAGFERLRNKLHLAPGIIEHQTVAESMERDHDRQRYARARIDEINDESRKKTTKFDPQARGRATEQRLAATTTARRPETERPTADTDPSGPAH